MPHCSMLKMLTVILLYANNPIATLLYALKQYAPTAIAQRHGMVRNHNCQYIYILISEVLYQKASKPLNLLCFKFTFLLSAGL